MKTVFCAVLYLLVSGAGQANTWQGYLLWNEKEETQASSLAVIYQGQRYDPPRRVQTTHDTIDRSSPETLLPSLLRAINQQDSETYDRLFLPGEELGRFRPTADNRDSILDLRRVIQFGEYSILILQVTNPKTSFPAVVQARKAGPEYYMTYLLETNRAFDFLKYYYAFAVLIGKPREQEIATADLFSEGHIYVTNYVAGDTNLWPPLIFRFQGRLYGTNTILEKLPDRSQQDLSSPTGTLCAAVSALKVGDANWYSELLHPLEKTNTVKYGMEGRGKGRLWDEWMCQRFPEAMRYAIPDRIRLVQEIHYYGDCTITAVQIRRVLAI